MKTNLVSLIAGFLFAIGLGISEMTQPAKIVGFLDIFGQWNPALGFVMAGAVGEDAIMFSLIRKRSAPLLVPRFSIPTQKDIDRPLLAGAAVFGIGWGISGLCPGPALMSLVTGSALIWVFVGFMVMGMVVGNWTQSVNWELPTSFSKKNESMRIRTTPQK